MSRLKRRSFKTVRRTSRGFTLLEVMLAFVIFAISFATVLEIMAGSMRSVRRASDDTEVALLAQSVMGLVGTEIPVEEGQFNGTSMERYDWQMDIYLYQSENAEAGTQELAELSGIELYGVELVIGWQSGRNDRNKRFSTIKSVLAERR
jgi:general secretion pathway protein I